MRKRVHFRNNWEEEEKQTKKKKKRAGSSSTCAADYPFSKYNKKVEMEKYTPEEYEKHLQGARTLSIFR
jgi:hypothetical protein